MTLRALQSFRVALTPSRLIGLILIFFAIYMSILFFNSTILDHDTYQRIYLAQRGEWSENFRPSWDVHKLHDRLMYSIWKTLFWLPEDSRAVVSAKILTHVSAWLFVLLSVLLSSKYSQNNNKVRLLWIFFASLGAPGLFFMVARAEDNVTYYPFFLLFIHFLLWPHFKKFPTGKTMKFACMSGLMLAICIQITTICSIFLTSVAAVPILFLLRRKELAISILFASISCIVAYEIMDLLFFPGAGRSLAKFVENVSNVEITNAQNRVSWDPRLLYRGFTLFLFLGLSERWIFPTALTVISVISYRLLWIWTVLAIPYFYRVLKVNRPPNIQQVLTGLGIIIAISLIPPLTIEWHLERWDFLWISGLMFLMVTVSVTAASLKKNRLTPYIRFLVYLTIATQLVWTAVNVLSETQLVLKNGDFEKVKTSIYDIRRTKTENVLLPAVPFQDFHGFTRAALPDRKLFYCERSRSELTACFRLDDKLNMTPIRVQIRESDIQSDRQAWWVDSSFQIWRLKNIR